MPKPIRLFVVPILLLLLGACANIKQPMGGPEDMEPPKVKKSIPENNSTNYKGKVIIIEFDEYVDGQKLNENMVISPLVDSKYEIITKKKTVTIKFRDAFKENTTYNINFGESVKDVTKGNFIRNLNLAFSTGPFIDSLSIKGNVTDFIKEVPVKDISILVYNADDTLSVRKHKPLYFSKTDAKGDFVLNNVKEGTYNIYALNDLNKNFKYDNEKESFAYLHKVAVKKNVDKLQFALTRTDKKGAIVIGTKQEFEYYILTLSEGIEQYVLRSDSGHVLSDFSEDGRQIKVFDSFHSKDSVNLYHQFTDSSGNVSDDTTRILFEEYKDRNKKNSFSLSIIPKSLEISKNDEIKIKVNKPVDKVDYDHIKLKRDSISIPYLTTELLLDSTRMNLRFINKYTFNDTLVLLLEKGAFITFTNDSNSVSKFKFRNKNEERYGIISGTVTCTAPDYIFQLVDNKGKVIDSKKNASKFSYKMLEPGEYRLKIIIDKNGNGRWDATDLDADLPPEPIIYYKDKINLRANWEILDLKFDAK